MNAPDNKSMEHATRRALLLAKIGYFGLLIIILLSSLLFSPPFNSSKLGLIIWWLPLLPPFFGILNNKPYTYAWANFIAAIYICRACTGFYLYPDNLVLGILELFFSSLWFGAGSYFARWRGIELGLQLKKANDKN